MDDIHKETATDIINELLRKLKEREAWLLRIHNWGITEHGYTELEHWLREEKLI